MNSVIPEAKPARALGTAGLVFGILSVFPLGALAGVPAVVLSAFALRGEPRSRGRATAGVVLGSFGVLVTVGLMLVFASVSNRSGLARPDASGSGVVSNGMYLVQGSLEEWAADSGAYPAPTDFDSDSSRFMRFLARDRVGWGGDTIPGSLPTNPFTKSSYRYGVDLFYFPDSLAAGVSYVSLPSDSNCPYVGKAAPARKPGTIVVYGHTDRTGRLPRVTEYGIIGFDDKVNEPLRDRTVPGVENYFVLFSLSALDEDR